MAKIADYGNGVLVFWCPACEEHHPYNVAHPSNPDGPKWEFNGDFEKPTFRPSLLIYDWKEIRKGRKKTACHLHVIDGQIEYCSDCPHELSGKTVPMVDIE